MPVSMTFRSNGEMNYALCFFDNFENLSPEAKKKLTHLNIFKCHLGLLEDMADEANGAHVGI